MKLLGRRFLLAGMVVGESLSFHSSCPATARDPKRALSPRVRLAFAFFVLTLNCFFGFSAIAQDVPSEGLKLANDIHETVDKVTVTVMLLSGKTYTGLMIVTHYRPDGPGPFPIVIFNHGRSTAMEKRAVPPRQRYTNVARYWIRRAALQYSCQRASAMGIADLFLTRNIPAAVAKIATSASLSLPSSRKSMRSRISPRHYPGPIPSDSSSWASLMAASPRSVRPAKIARG